MSSLLNRFKEGRLDDVFGGSGINSDNYKDFLCIGPCTVTTPAPPPKVPRSPMSPISPTPSPWGAPTILPPQPPPGPNVPVGG